jgi:hypothetical protein
VVRSSLGPRTVSLADVSEGADQSSPSSSPSSNHSAVRGSVAPRYCGWCGRQLPEAGTVGRRRRYCGRSCRQRAYEGRAATERSGLPENAVVRSDHQIDTLQDRLVQLRQSVEQVVSAFDDGADPVELRRMAVDLLRVAKELEQLR